MEFTDGRAISLYHTIITTSCYL